MLACPRDVEEVENKTGQSHQCDEVSESAQLSHRKRTFLFAQGVHDA